MAYRARRTRNASLDSTINETLGPLMKFRVNPAPGVPLMQPWAAGPQCQFNLGKGGNRLPSTKIWESST